MRIFFLYCFIIISTLSCSNNYYGPDGGQQEVFATISDEELSLEIIYVGTTPNYHIFETIIENHGEDDLKVYKDDFHMYLVKKHEIIKPLSTETIIPSLRKEKSNLKKEKKNRTILGALLTGVGILASATTGLPVAENILYSSESVFYILDERRFMQRNIDSVDDEINYLKQRNLDQLIIPPNSYKSKDLLFPVKKTRGDIEIIYNSNGREYSLVFSSKDILTNIY